MNKKSQMEIMGLAVIVILLALGMYYVAKFTVFKTQPTTSQTSRQREIATGFVNTLLNTNAGCTGSSANYAKLIEQMVQPQYSNINGCTGSLSDHFKTSVRRILSQTLDLWGYKYKLSLIFPNSVKTQGGNVQDIDIDDPTNGCATLPQQEAAPPFPIPTDYGDVRVIMKICY